MENIIDNKYIGNISIEEKRECIVLIDKMIELMQLAQREGILSLEEEIEKNNIGIFIKNCILLVVDGINPNFVERYINNIILREEKKGVELLKQYITLASVIYIQAGLYSDNTKYYLTNILENANDFIIPSIKDIYEFEESYKKNDYFDKKEAINNLSLVLRDYINNIDEIDKNNCILLFKDLIKISNGCWRDANYLLNNIDLIKDKFAKKLFGIVAPYLIANKKFEEVKNNIKEDEIFNNSKEYWRRQNLENHYIIIEYASRSIATDNKEGIEFLRQLMIFESAKLITSVYPPRIIEIFLYSYFGEGFVFDESYKDSEKAKEYRLFKN